MPTTIDIDLSPEQYHLDDQRLQAVARVMGLKTSDIGHIEVVRRSLDSRRTTRYHATVQVYLADEKYVMPSFDGCYRDCHTAPPIVIVGAGPAGLFAALRALQLGLRPIIVERGKPVEHRKYDLAPIAQQGIVNPDSNWCFGEGGAGTYSDGKLYTRSTKRGNVADVLNRFVEHGANPAILIDAHAHIGTDRLSGIIARMRATIEEHGGCYHFSSRVVDLLLRDGRAVGVRCADGTTVEGLAVVLATGHSSREVYELFAQRGWLLQAKPFALGVRVEHPQMLINHLQYHSQHPSPYLPPAAYSLTAQVEGHGVFSFCMCPGGIIVPAATGPNQQVVNGMSNSRRNSAYANSGIAVTIGIDDVPHLAHLGPLALLRFQQEIEQRTFSLAGDTIAAPMQRLTDFLADRATTVNNTTNYLGHTVAASLADCLPMFVVQALKEGFKAFDRKMRGFITREASLLAVESRTSSPVRIPRDPTTLQHPQIANLYPCGEGAGYAGGIVSSALDGINVVNTIAQSL